MSMQRVYEIPAEQAAQIVNELRWARLHWVDSQLELERATYDEELTQAQIDDTVALARIAFDQAYPALATLRRKTLRGAS